MNNLDLLNQFIVAGVVLVPIITSVTEVVKKTFNVAARFIPLVAIGTGVLLSLLFVDTSVVGGVAGLLMGLSSVGFWEVGKTTIIGKTSKPE